MFACKDSRNGVGCQFEIESLRGGGRTECPSVSDEFVGEAEGFIKIGDVVTYVAKRLKAWLEFNSGTGIYPKGYHGKNQY